MIRSECLTFSMVSPSGGARISPRGGRDIIFSASNLGGIIWFRENFDMSKTRGKASVGILLPEKSVKKKTPQR